MKKAVVARDLTKTYGKIKAIDSLNFSVNSGEIFGFIGPDGAGKTTIFRIITTLILPDAGNIEVLGYDAIKDYKNLRNVLGYMPGRFSLYEDLSVEENLSFFASIFNTTIDENYDLIKDIYQQIEPFKTRRAGKLSGGMKQKLALSCALIHSPELLVLDEPTTGVDAVSRKEFWEMLAKIKDSGITIVVSTPYMDEASLCDRVALIQNGNILDIDPPEAIVDKFADNLIGIKSEDKYKLIKSLQDFEHTKSVYPFGQYIHYIDKRSNILADDIQNYLHSIGIVDAKAELVKPDIEDTFMSLMRSNANE